MSILRRRSFRVLLIVLAVLLVLIGACAIYLGSYYRADTAVIATFAKAEGITREVLADGSMVFLPESAQTGLVFYPGGKVEHTAYVPLMEALAAQGVLCVLIEMPFRLAVFDVNAADGVQEEFPQIERWYIGGHSLGGSMAAAYLEEHENAFDGLFLLGSYSTADLSGTGLSVLSVYGSKDGVMNRDKYAECVKNLPTDFTEVVIEGGNHAQFGVYGMQSGDDAAKITNEAQILQTALEFASFVKK